MDLHNLFYLSHTTNAQNSIENSLQSDIMLQDTID